MNGNLIGISLLLILIGVIIYDNHKDNHKTITAPTSHIEPGPS